MVLIAHIKYFIYNIAVVSSKAKLLWPPYTSIKAINFSLLFGTLFLVVNFVDK